MGVPSFIPRFEDLRGALEETADVSFVLDSNLCLVYRNPAWDRFASENDAPELASEAVIGTDLQRVIGRDLVPFYRAAFQKVQQERVAWNCLYECSSRQVFRKFRMQIHPLAPSGYLVRNNLLVEHPHVEVALADNATYVHADSFIKVCMHCRCSRRANDPHRWDFVPAYLERGLANVSHSLCAMCLDYFYPKEPDL